MAEAASSASALPSEGVLVLCVIYTVFKINSKRNLAHCLFEGLEVYATPSDADIARLSGKNRPPDAVAGLRHLQQLRRVVITASSLILQPFFETYDSVVWSATVAGAATVLSLVYSCVAPAAAGTLWLPSLLLLAAASALWCNATMLWSLGTSLANVQMALAAGILGFIISFPAAHIPVSWLDCDIHASFATLHRGLAVMAAALDSERQQQLAGSGGGGGGGGGKVNSVSLGAGGGGGGGRGGFWLDDEELPSVFGLSPRAFATVCHIVLSVVAAAVAAAVPMPALLFGQTAAEQLRAAGGSGGGGGGAWRQRKRCLLLFLDLLLPWLAFATWVPPLALPPLRLLMGAAAAGTGLSLPPPLAALRLLRTILTAAALLLRLRLSRRHLQTFLDMAPVRAARAELGGSSVDAGAVRTHFSARVSYLPIAAATYVCLPLAAAAALFLYSYSSGYTTDLCDLGRGALGLPPCRQLAAAAAAAAVAAADGGAGAMRALMEEPTLGAARRFAKELDVAHFFPSAGGAAAPAAAAAAAAAAAPNTEVISFLLAWGLFLWASCHTAAFLYWRRRPLEVQPRVLVDRTTQKKTA